jgi:hypothetical protein
MRKPFDVLAEGLLLKKVGQKDLILRSTTGQLLQLFGVSFSMHCDLGSGGLDFAEIICCKFH